MASTSQNSFDIRTFKQFTGKTQRNFRIEWLPPRRAGVSGRRPTSTEWTMRRASAHHAGTRKIWLCSEILRLNVIVEEWCPGEDSNLHLFQDWYLKPARLPIPPPGLALSAEGFLRGCGGGVNRKNAREAPLRKLSHPSRMRGGGASSSASPEGLGLSSAKVGPALIITNRMRMMWWAATKATSVCTAIATRLISASPPGE